MHALSPRMVGLSLVAALFASPNYRCTDGVYCRSSRAGGRIVYADESAAARACDAEPQCTSFDFNEAGGWKPRNLNSPPTTSAASSA